MATFLIVYHSRTGGSRQMAEAAAAGAGEEEETRTLLKTADDAGPDDLLGADGYLFCAPENLRLVRRTAMQTAVRMITTGVMLALLAGIAIKLKIFGGSP